MISPSISHAESLLRHIQGVLKSLQITLYCNSGSGWSLATKFWKFVYKHPNMTRATCYNQTHKNGHLTAVTLYRSQQT